MSGNTRQALRTREVDEESGAGVDGRGVQVGLLQLSGANKKSLAGADGKCYDAALDAQCAHIIIPILGGAATLGVGHCPDEALGEDPWHV